MNSNSAIKIADGVEGLFIKNTRFNTTLISLNFYMSLENETVSKNAMLTYILSTCSGRFGGFKEMNRHYNRGKYLSLIDYAYELMPELSVTSDIIVGFPGETYDEFCDTLSLVERVKYTSLFTFIFSPRKGTRAYDMEDPVSRQEKGVWFKELTDLQERIAGERTARMKGRAYRVLVEEKAKNDGFLSGRTQGNVIIEFEGDESLIGTFADVKVTNPRTWIVYGELV